MNVKPTQPRKTIGEVFDHLAPGCTWRGLLEWPPDVFALTGMLLQESGAYRLVVSPPAGAKWPPRAGWQTEISKAAREWPSWAVGQRKTMPRALRQFGHKFGKGFDIAVSDLTLPEHWSLCTALLSLHAMADEASAGLAAPQKGPHGFVWRVFHLTANERLRRTGSLSSLPPDRVRVLPKLRVPRVGITARSLSRHLAIDNSEIETTWLTGAFLPTLTANTLNMLLIPWPETILPRDFHEVITPISLPDPQGFGFFDVTVSSRVDLEKLRGIVRKAKAQVGHIEVVILPESALCPDHIVPLQELLRCEEIPLLVAGVKEPATSATGFGRNYVHLGMLSGVKWFSYEQDKHHRWCLEEEQIHQYHLGATLHSQTRWWEAIEIPKRRLTFVSIGQGLLVCPLICEDLARQEPVTNLIRAVGPALVLAILFDGPQLASRWPARYATVLADDPGTSVLTFTSIGMAERCLPQGCARSRVVALWRDRRRGTVEIALDPAAEAIVVATHILRTATFTADCRSDGGSAQEIILAGVEQVGSAGLAPRPAVEA